MVGTKPVEFLFLQERCLKGVGEGGGDGDGGSSSCGAYRSEEGEGTTFGGLTSHLGRFSNFCKGVSLRD